jgi:hypothetical protein
MSVEGIGGLKWSLGKDPDGTWSVLQGTQEIAKGIKDAKVATLLCGAPQLWAAANEFLLDQDRLDPDIMHSIGGLGEQVARCVGKGSWKEVAQS